jgi:hypothetical protein
LLLNHGCHLINKVLLLLNLELICLHHDVWSVKTPCITLEM